MFCSHMPTSRSPFVLSLGVSHRSHEQKKKILLPLQFPLRLKCLRKDAESVIIVIYIMVCVQVLLPGGVAPNSGMGNKSGKKIHIWVRDVIHAMFLNTRVKIIVIVSCVKCTKNLHLHYPLRI